MNGSENLKSHYWGLGIGVATFFINITTSSRSSINGVVTCSYIDYFALIAGVCLLVFGLVKVFGSKGNSTALLLSIAIIGLGAVHVARGLGLLMSPCG